MIYRVIEDFTDLENGHKYKKGDLYPCEDYFPKDERIKELENRQAEVGSKVAKIGGELEMLKAGMAQKYKPDQGKEYNFEFDFQNNAIIFEEP